jgi:tripartite-type tricarboxylate transporter receptor subunit TctC
MKTRFAAGLSALLLVPLLSFGQGAESYPAKPIRIVVNFPPGGSVDMMGRSIAQKLSDAFGQAVVVENRAGASGNIGAESVAKSAADGYTLLMTNGATVTTNPHLYRMAFDTMTELTPVTQVARISSMLAVHPSLPVRSATEFLAYARANPGKLTYGSAGNGSGPHITAESMNRMARISTVHIPYKGIGPAQSDLLAGQLNFMFVDGSAYAQIRAGKLRMLAVATGNRLSLLPDTPTMIEAGVPGFNYDSAHLLAAPGGTPREIIARLNAEVVKLLRSPEVNERIRATVAEVIANSPDEASASLRADFQRIGKLIQEMSIRAD